MAENPKQSELNEEAERNPTSQQEGRERQAKDSMPLEAGREALTDLSSDNAGQRTEVEHPWSGEGGVQRGVERTMHEDRRRRS